MTDINRDEIFQKNSQEHPLWSQKEWRIFLSESRTSWRETKKIQIKLATTGNKNKKQQDAKNNVQFYTKLTKKTWKSSEKTIRWGRNKSIKA
jgi:hypothetical protein